MIEHNSGFLFYGRSYSDGSFGLLCNYKYNVGVRGDKYATLTYVVDANGKPCVPAVFTVSTGFAPVTSVYSTEAEVASYFKGRKPVFGRFGDFTMVVSGTVVQKEGKDIDMSRLDFYIPRGILTDYQGECDSNGNPYPVLLCDRVSNIQGLNTFVVSQQLLNAYKEKFVQAVGIENLFTDRALFYKGLSNVG